MPHFGHSLAESLLYNITKIDIFNKNHDSLSLFLFQTVEITIWRDPRRPWSIINYFNIRQLSILTIWKICFIKYYKSRLFLYKERLLYIVILQINKFYWCKFLFYSIRWNKIMFYSLTVRLVTVILTLNYSRVIVLSPSQQDEDVVASEALACFTISQLHICLTVPVLSSTTLFRPPQLKRSVLRFNFTPTEASSCAKDSTMIASVLLVILGKQPNSNWVMHCHSGYIQ